MFYKIKKLLQENEGEIKKTKVVANIYSNFGNLFKIIILIIYMTMSIIFVFNY